MKCVVPGGEGKVHKEGKMEFAHAYLYDAYLYDAHCTTLYEEAIVQHSTTQYKEAHCTSLPAEEIVTTQPLLLQWSLQSSVCTVELWIFEEIGFCGTLPPYSWDTPNSCEQY